MMTREEAEEVERLIRCRFPEADVDVLRIAAGVRIEICSPGSTLVAVLGENSPVLMMLTGGEE